MGFSFHDRADVLEKILTEHPESEFVQLQINYLDWENPDVEARKCYEVALAHKKEIIIMEPVKGGRLAQVPPLATQIFKNQNENMSIPSWAIRFGASLKNVIMVLSGMSNIEQMLDNTSYMKDCIPLTEEEVNLCFKVADIIKASASIPCTSCKYCIDGCPKNILIPEYFSLYNKALNDDRPSFDALKTQYEHIFETSGKPFDCIDCKQCENICPQHIKIVESLKNVTKKFS